MQVPEKKNPANSQKLKNQKNQRKKRVSEDGSVKKKEKGGVMRIAVPIAAVLILGVLGVVGYIVAKGMMEGDTAIDSLRTK